MRNTRLELTIQLPEGDASVAVTGVAERNIKLIREAFGVNMTSRGGALKIRGDASAVNRAAHVVQRLTAEAGRRRPLSHERLLELVSDVSQRDVEPTGRLAPGAEPGDGPMDVYLPGRVVRGKTPGQEAYLEAIGRHDLTFCVGPAGTGKTYLAVAAAVNMLKHGRVRRIVLARPAVEAGERLGFLPGNMQDKVNPYLRPLLDALHDMMSFEQVQRFMATDLIEIVPLAFMRGRTLNDAMILLDEAQNTTRSQMLMFLTRMGQGSKTIVTGDTTQIDLEDPRESGLIDAARRLRRVQGVAFCALDQQDIVRHTLVQRIVEAYGQSAVRRALDETRDPPAEPAIPDNDASSEHAEPG